MIRIFSIVLVIFLWVLNGCIQEPKFSDVPEISFNSIRKVNKIIKNDLLGEVNADSVILAVNFKDGNGDLGLTNDEINSNPAYQNFSNFLVTTKIKVNGKYETADINPKLGGLINFKLLPNQKPGPIEGVITYSTVFIYKLYAGYSPLFKEKNDTLKFQIQLIDNAFNASNIIETDSVIIFQN